MALSESETQRLVDRAAGGDDVAVDELLLQYRGRLGQMIRARMDTRVRARVDPSDVVQEALTTATKDLPEYLRTQPIPFYPWLRRIAWNSLLHQHERHIDAQKRSVRRERHREHGLSDQSTMLIARLFDPRAASPSAAMSKAEQQQRVRAALGRLPEVEQEVLLQRYVERLSIREVAAGLGLSEAAAYKRHARALEKLRRVLEGADS